MKYVTVKLTIAEAKCLTICATNGATRICNDQATAKEYLGGRRGIAAYNRATKKLLEALVVYDVDDMATHLLRELCAADV